MNNYVRNRTFQNVLIPEGHVWMTSGSRLFYRMFWDFTWTIFRNKHKAHRASTTLRQGSVVTLDLRTTSRNIIKPIPSDPTSLACTKHKIPLASCPSQNSFVLKISMQIRLRSLCALMLNHNI